MDPTTKGNLLIFFGAMLALAAFWLVVSGLTGGGVFALALGVCAAVGCVAVFRVYAGSRDERD